MPMSLRDKYQNAVQTAKSLHMEGSAEEKDGKLHFKGTVNSVDEKNRIWNAIKSVPGWEQDVVADLRVNEHAPAAVGTSGSAQGGRTYTVKSGDTLSRIAKEFYGDAQAYNRIFDANRDQLNDPNKIQPGQVLKIPV
jgi:nucleoid-associated protein YgaU